MKKILFPLTIVLLSLGCSKDSEDNQAPAITVTSPTDNQTFTAGQTVNVVATVSDNDEIHHVELKVINAATNAAVLSFEEHVDGKTYELNKTFTAESGVMYHIEIEATDHNDNDAEKLIMISAS